MEYAEALSSNRPSKRKPPKQLDHLRVREAENEGHVVEHHFTSYAHEPEHHVFGKGQHVEMMAHIGKHMNVQIPGNEADGAEAEEMEE